MVNYNIFKVDNQNENEIINIMAGHINNNLRNGFSGCVFKFHDYEYKTICTLIQMLKEAGYFTTLMHVKDKEKINYYLRIELITKGKKE